MTDLARTLFIALTALLSLAGCHGVQGCPRLDDIDAASKYEYLSSADGREWFQPPPNEWADHPRLATFLRSIVSEGGTEELVSGHRFTCVPAGDPGCAGCQLCTRRHTTSYPKFNLLEGWACSANGEMFVRAHIGPGAAVRAETFWKFPDPTAR
jgi:hypothetical protein